MTRKYCAFAATTCGARSGKSSSCGVPRGRWDLAVLSQCLECNAKSYSQGFLTKAFLSFREHHTNISKLHDGECEQNIATVSAIEVKNPSLRAVNRENTTDFPRKLQKDHMTRLTRVPVCALPFCTMRVDFASSLLHREHHPTHTAPNRQRRKEVDMKWDAVVSQCCRTPFLQY